MDSLTLSVHAEEKSHSKVGQAVARALSPLTLLIALAIVQAHTHTKIKIEPLHPPDRCRLCKNPTLHT